MTPLSALIVLLLVKPIPLPAEDIGGLYDIYDWAPLAGVHLGNRPQLRADPRQQNSDQRQRNPEVVPHRPPSSNQPVLPKETEEAIAYLEDLLTGRLDLPKDLPGNVPESTDRNPPSPVASVDYSTDKSTDVVSSVTVNYTKGVSDGHTEDEPVQPRPTTGAVQDQRPEAGDASSGEVGEKEGGTVTGVSQDTSPLPETQTPKQVMAAAEPQTKEQQFSSPCPGVFSYDRPRPGKERWYGEIQVTTDETLTEFNLDVELDKAAHYLGAWLGEVSSLDNIRYTIHSRKRKIQPGPPLPVKVFIKYSNKEVEPPRLKSLRLNGRLICPNDTGSQGTPNRQTPRNPSANGPTRQAANSPKAAPTSTAQSPISTGSRVPNKNVSNGNVRPTTSVPVEKTIASNFGNKLAEDTEFVDGVACGRIEVQPTPLITNGQRTSRGQWPWHAAIYQLKDTDLLFICGGSLIGIKTILTAAHCVTPRFDNPVKPESLMVYLGKYHLKMWTEGGIQGKQVSEIHVNPEYNDTSSHADIAILILSSPVEFTAYVKPVCLWDRNRVQLSEVEGRDGVVVGWGKDEHGVVSEELKMATMPVVSQQVCIWSNPQFYSQYSSGSTFCAGFRNGTSPCNGDSGGGMVFPKIMGKGGSDPPTWTLRGIVSLSVSKTDKRVCDTEHYAVFTDVVKFYNWINKYI